MKKLYLVRHAKSSWDFPHLSDHDRPLNNRGARDAPRMAAYLSNQISAPELFVCSTSLRTNLTASYFLKAFGKPFNSLQKNEKLYHSGINEFEAVVGQLKDGCQSAMLFGHNPGITNYVNVLCNEFIDNIPTCGVAGIELNIGHWGDIGKANGRLLFYYYPKGI